MRKRPRRNHSPSFKAKMAVDAIKGEKTLDELHDVHPDQIVDWKNQLLERAASVFGAESSAQPAIPVGAEASLCQRCPRQPPPFFRSPSRRFSVRTRWCVLPCKRCLPSRWLHLSRKAAQVSESRSRSRPSMMTRTTKP